MDRAYASPINRKRRILRRPFHIFQTTVHTVILNQILVGVQDRKVYRLT